MVFKPNEEFKQSNKIWLADFLNIVSSSVSQNQSALILLLKSVLRNDLTKVLLF